MSREGSLADALYFEDLQPGMKIRSIRSYEITAQEIKEFAAKYDPQPFHLDEAAAEKTFFKGLAASGWMTAAITMRLRVESMHVAGGMIGAGVDEIKFTQPVRPGDWLRTETEILSARRSTLQPEDRRRQVPHPGLQPARRVSHALRRELHRAPKSVVLSSQFPVVSFPGRSVVAFPEN